MTEHFFTSWDGARLFYRAWLPETPAAKALVLFHRGHEHSGRFEEVARELGPPEFAVFAYDARGHGRSAGDVGSFACLVRDADCFVRHVSSVHAIPVENVAVLAHSIGAVVAAAWVHDYAPPVRAMVLASPAFRVKLYVPFALPFLRLRLKFQTRAFVKSYVRPAMLTHDPAERESYARDPLISRNVAVSLLVEMHDASTRLVADAAAIRTPTLILSSGTDYVVQLPPQREFFRRLGSPVKHIEEYPGFYHDLLHEAGRERPLAQAREFLRRAFEQPIAEDGLASNQAEYARLSQKLRPLSPGKPEMGRPTAVSENRGATQPGNPHRLAVWLRLRRVAGLRLPRPAGRRHVPRPPDRPHLFERSRLARNPLAKTATWKRCWAWPSTSCAPRDVPSASSTRRRRRPVRA